MPLMPFFPPPSPISLLHCSPVAVGYSPRTASHSPTHFASALHLVQCKMKFPSPSSAKGFCDVLMQQHLFYVIAFLPGSTTIQYRQYVLTLTLQPRPWCFWMLGMHQPTLHVLYSYSVSVENFISMSMLEVEQIAHVSERATVSVYRPRSACSSIMSLLFIT